jgi:hypothetical protein
LVAALLGGGLLILWMGRGTVFLEDEWALVATRLGGDLDTYLEPHNEHLLLLPVIVFKLLFATIGLDDYWVYRLSVVIVHLVCVALLFTLVERRRGPLVAALVSAPILVLGSASEVLLFPINMSFAGSMAAGLGTMLALDARSRRGDAVACVLILVALASSGLGISIALGALVEVIWREDRWRRLWIVAAPAALYVAWYLAYNLDLERRGPLQYLEAPEFAVRVGGAAIAALLGIPEFETGGTAVRPWAERIGIGLLIASVAVLALLVVRRRSLSPRLAMLLATLGSYWALLGVARAFTNAPGAPRYTYAGAILIVLIAVEATADLALPRVAVAGLAAIALTAAALNVHWLDWNGDLNRADSRLTAAELGGLELARGEVDPAFVPILRPAYPLTAAGYFAAIDQLEGSIATPAGELPTSPERERLATDAVLVRGTVERLPYTRATRRFIRAAGTALGERRCRPAQAGTTIARVEHALVIRPGGSPVVVRARRFARSFSPVASVEGPTLLLMPSGRSRRRWEVAASASAAFQMC